MEMVIVEIEVPAISRKFDFRLPSTGKIRDIVAEIARVLEITQGNILFDTEALLLCDRDTGRVLDPGMTVAELQIKDGSMLMLL